MQQQVLHCNKFMGGGNPFPPLGQRAKAMAGQAFGQTDMASSVAAVIVQPGAELAPGAIYPNNTELWLESR